MTVPINGGFASPLADAEYAVPLSPDTGGFLSWVYQEFSGFNIIAIGLLTIVLYDQCGLKNLLTFQISLDFVWRVAECLLVKYVWDKGSIEGPNWKIPFMGPFLECIYPKMDSYKAKWASGELSCVSVFHK